MNKKRKQYGVERRRRRKLKTNKNKGRQKWINSEEKNFVKREKAK